jgi:membrane protease YdiL (CAAX protease family)
VTEASSWVPQSTKVGSAVLIAVPAVDLAAVAVSVFGGFYITLFRVSAASGDWIAPDFMAGLTFLVLLLPLICLAGGLRFSEIGLTAERLRRALPAGLGMWVVSQLIVLGNHGAFLAPGQLGHSIAEAVEFLMAGTLVEDIVYRGFLIPQLYLHLPGPPRARASGAILISSVVFTTMHIAPRLGLQHLKGGALTGDLTVIFVMGLLLATLFVVTGNLWLVAVVHAFLDVPVQVRGSINVGRGAMAIASVILLILSVSSLRQLWWA